MSRGDYTIDTSIQNEREFLGRRQSGSLTWGHLRVTRPEREGGVWKVEAGLGMDAVEVSVSDEVMKRLFQFAVGADPDPEPAEPVDVYWVDFLDDDPPPPPPEPFIGGEDD